MARIAVGSSHSDLMSLHADTGALPWRVAMELRQPFQRSAV